MATKLTAKSKKSDIISRINSLRGQYELGYPKGEAALDTISNANLITILTELEAEIAVYEAAADSPEEPELDEEARLKAQAADDDFDPITDPEVTPEELDATRAKIAAGTTATIQDLLAKLAAEKTQAGRKKIRAALRKAGYKVSEHKS